MFTHEKLQVYAKALDFVAGVGNWTSKWDKKHAIVDHLPRAAESIALNLAEAARQGSVRARLRSLDYSVGSSLECAGCLDIAAIKKLFTRDECLVDKRKLCEITKMLVGLRKAWAERLREEVATAESNPSGPLFHHENLQVYRKALAFVEWFVSQGEAKELGNKPFKQIDEAATSVVLNTAEGNGRYAELDQLHFIELAQKGAVKAMVYLDLCAARELMSATSVTQGKEILGQVSAMLGGF